MTTVGQTETHDAVLRLNEGGESCKVGGRSGVRLDIDTPDFWVEIEGGECTLLADDLDLVNVLVASVVLRMTR